MPRQNDEHEYSFDPQNEKSATHWHTPSAPAQQRTQSANNQTISNDSPITEAPTQQTSKQQAPVANPQNTPLIQPLNSPNLLLAGFPNLGKNLKSLGGLGMGYESTCRKMQAETGVDLSHLTIVPNSSKADKAQAQALCVGDEIHFGAGFYNPNDQKSLRLFVHELTHYVQQQKNRVKETPFGQNADPRLEAEADSVAAQMEAGKNPQMGTFTSGSGKASKDIEQHKPVKKFVHSKVGGYWQEKDSLGNIERYIVGDDIVMRDNITNEVWWKAKDGQELSVAHFHANRPQWQALDDADYAVLELPARKKISTNTDIVSTQNVGVENPSIRTTTADADTSRPLVAEEGLGWDDIWAEMLSIGMQFGSEFLMAAGTNILESSPLGKAFMLGKAAYFIYQGEYKQALLETTKALVPGGKIIADLVDKGETGVDLVGALYDRDLKKLKNIAISEAAGKAAGSKKVMDAIQTKVIDPYLPALKAKEEQLSPTEQKIKEKLESIQDALNQYSKMLEQALLPKTPNTSKKPPTNTPKRKARKKRPSEQESEIPVTPVKEGENLPSENQQLPADKEGENLPSENQQLPADKEGENLPSENQRLPADKEGENLPAENQQLPADKEGENLPAQNQQPRANTKNEEYTENIKNIFLQKKDNNSLNEFNKYISFIATKKANIENELAQLGVAGLTKQQVNELKDPKYITAKQLIFQKFGNIETIDKENKKFLSEVAKLVNNSNKKVEFSFKNETLTYTERPLAPPAIEVYAQMLEKVSKGAPMNEKLGTAKLAADKQDQGLTDALTNIVFYNGHAKNEAGITRSNDIFNRLRDTGNARIKERETAYKSDPVAQQTKEQFGKLTEEKRKKAFPELARIESISDPAERKKARTEYETNQSPDDKDMLAGLEKEKLELEPKFMSAKILEHYLRALAQYSDKKVFEDFKFLYESKTVKHKDWEEFANKSFASNPNNPTLPLSKNAAEELQKAAELVRTNQLSADKEFSLSIDKQGLPSFKIVNKAGVKKSELMDETYEERLQRFAEKNGYQQNSTQKISDFFGKQGVNIPPNQMAVLNTGFNQKQVGITDDETFARHKSLIEADRTNNPIVKDRNKANTAYFEVAVPIIVTKNGVSSPMLNSDGKPILQALDGKIFTSGESNIHVKSELLPHSPVDSKNKEGADAVKPIRRDFDTEYQFLNAAANMLGGDILNPKPEIWGTIRIASHYPYCPSCTRAILVFSKMFPNMRIEFSDGTEGNKKYKF